MKEKVRMLMLRGIIGEGSKGRDLWEKRHIGGLF